LYLITSMSSFEFRTSISSSITLRSMALIVSASSITS